MVVGSGPAGVAAARAALAYGARVVMLDVGLALEPERDSVKRRMAATEPARWSREDLDVLVEDPFSDRLEGFFKPVFGSDFVYRLDDQLELQGSERVPLAPTLARGGFSNVWGATLLPYRPDDLAGWPLELDRLAPHYERVLDSLPVAAHNDELASRYPLYTSNHQPHRLGRQASDLLSDLRRDPDTLRRRMVHFGASRLALRAAPGECLSCGHCLHGCPYDFIWSADHALAELRRNERFEYRSGAFVVRCAGDAKRGTVEVRSTVTGAVERITADRIFLAAGVLGTTAIVLDSLGSYDVAVEVKDSQLFILPLLQLHHDRSVSREDRITLTEVFVDIDDPGVCDMPVRLQVYGYSDSVRRGAARAHPRLFPLLSRAFDLAVPSLLTAFGYVHSDYSDSISVRLSPGNGPRQRLELEPIANPAGREVMRRAAAKLRSLRRTARVVPLTPLMRMSGAGQGFHSGGSFPMRERPGELETDLLGRVPALDRVHLVDASVFPTVPAGPITLSAMANASRIATEAWEA